MSAGADPSGSMSRSVCPGCQGLEDFPLNVSTAENWTLSKDGNLDHSDQIESEVWGISDVSEFVHCHCLDALVVSCSGFMARC